MDNSKTKLIYELTLPIRWYDMDAYGHVNTSVYFTYFEQTRINWFINSDLNFTAENTGPVVVDAQCTFLKPIIYPEIIQIKLFANPPGRSSIETFYEIVSKTDTNIKYATGYAKIVWVDRKAEHSIPLPLEIRTILSD